MQTHSFNAFYNPDSIYLFLGSFPSVKSRERNFYYMHPKNRFYPLLEEVFNDSFTTQDIEEKKVLLKKHKIALFDVIESCEITGSSDSSIKNVKVNDIEKILNNSNIQYIILNGKLAYNLFIKYFLIIIIIFLLKIRINLSFFFIYNIYIHTTHLQANYTYIITNIIPLY